MVHIGENAVVIPSHQGPLHGDSGPRKNMLRLGQVVHDLIYSPVYG